MIPDEAVEAAANSFFAGLSYVHPESRADMRSALEAAIPFLLARERVAALIAEYGDEVRGGIDGPQETEYKYADKVIGATK